MELNKKAAPQHLIHFAQQNIHHQVVLNQINRIPISYKLHQLFNFTYLPIRDQFHSLARALSFCFLY